MSTKARITTTKTSRSFATTLPERRSSRDVLLRSEHVAGKRGPTTWQDDVLRALARTFHASRETILRRLLTLNLATQAHYREKRRQFIAEYAQRAAQQPEGFAPHHRVQISGAGPLFTHSCRSVQPRANYSERRVGLPLDTRQAPTGDRT